MLPLEKPAMVLDARTVLVGSPDDAPRSSTVMFGLTPLHVSHKSEKSTRVSVPVTVGVKVCPDQNVVVMGLKAFNAPVFCALRPSPPVMASLTSQGLAVALTLVPVPAEKSPWVVSVKQLEATGAKSVCKAG